MTNFEYTMHNGNTIHLTATDFAKLRGAIGNASASKNALKVDAFSNTETSLDKGTQRKTTENELPSLTQCTA